mmetsp:Transcript_19298/g.64684  ORF Transcript_19298/g.64684 Transcript_19298/m.64684 type:complete len:352 (+) Transcript_19298:1002-2057(+)
MEAPLLAADGDKAAEEGEGDEGRGADGEALAHRRRGVARRVQCVRAVAHVVPHLSHLRNAARIVCNGSVRVDGEACGHGGEDARGGHSHAVHAGQPLGRVDGRAEAHHWHHHRPVPQREAVDDVGRRARLAGGSHLPHRRARMRRVEFGGRPDCEARPEAAGRAQEHVPVGHARLAAHGEWLPRQEGIGHGEGQGRLEHRGEHELALERGLNLRVGARAAARGRREGGCHAGHEARGGHGQREVHGQPPAEVRGRGGDGHGSAGGLGEGAEQVRPHASHVADIVADIVSDHCRVARVVLRDVLLHLAHEVGAHVRRLGVDAPAHAPEERDGRPAESVPSYSLVHTPRGLRV